MKTISDNSGKSCSPDSDLSENRTIDLDRIEEVILDENWDGLRPIRKILYKLDSIVRKFKR